MVEHSSLRTSSTQSLSGIAEHPATIGQGPASALTLVNVLAGDRTAVPDGEAVTEQMVRTILRVRRNRDRFFRAQLFADPAWDMLLELYASELGQQRISVSSLCLGAAVPATTALRWITNLEQEGLAERRPDPTDGRRYFIQLTRAGRDAMDNFFRAVPSIAPMI